LGADTQRCSDRPGRYANGVEDGATEYIGYAEGFHLFEEPADGAEMFSLFRRSPLGPEEYIDRFFDTGSEYQDHAQ
jgi:hypothetical protein